MTISSTHSEMFGQRLPDEDEQGSANQLGQILASQMSEGTDEVNLQILVDNKPTTIALHRSLSETFTGITSCSRGWRCSDIGASS